MKATPPNVPPAIAAVLEPDLFCVVLDRLASFKSESELEMVGVEIGGAVGVGVGVGVESPVTVTVSVGLCWVAHGAPLNKLEHKLS